MLFWNRPVLMLVAFNFVVGFLAAAAAADGSTKVCPLPNLIDAVLGLKPSFGHLHSSDNAFQCFQPLRPRVAELDELQLARALNILLQNGYSYVAILFYATWCPFSKMFRPTFDRLSSMFPTIFHVAVEESATRPSMLSRNGIHSFPTLVLQNQFGKVSYHGARTLDSLIHFYTNITGIDIVLSNSVEENNDLTVLSMLKDANTTVHCPYSWARTPDKLLQQGTCLTLAILFLVLRALYILYPKLLVWLNFIWQQHFQSKNRANMTDNPTTFVEKVLHRTLKFYKKKNIQEGAIHATAWASKSLASVSLGEGSISKVSSSGELH